MSYIRPINCSAHSIIRQSVKEFSHAIRISENIVMMLQCYKQIFRLRNITLSTLIKNLYYNKKATWSDSFENINTTVKDSGKQNVCGKILILIMLRSNNSYTKRNFTELFDQKLIIQGSELNVNHNNVSANILVCLFRTINAPVWLRLYALSTVPKL